MAWSVVVLKRMDGGGLGLTLLRRVRLRVGVRRSMGRLKGSVLLLLLLGFTIRPRIRRVGDSSWTVKLEPPQRNRLLLVLCRLLLPLLHLGDSSRTEHRLDVGNGLLSEGVADLDEGDRDEAGSTGSSDGLRDEPARKCHTGEIRRLDG
jgi:hypothetical protein